MYSFYTCIIITYKPNTNIVKGLIRREQAKYKKEDKGYNISPEAKLKLKNALMPGIDSNRHRSQNSWQDDDSVQSIIPC
jgi:hypothetical protein